MIIDGRALARVVLARAKEKTENLGRTPRVVALVASDTPATKSYLTIKTQRAEEAGCVLEVVRFPESVTTAELVAAIHSTDADAILVQLPLPLQVDAAAVCDSIPLEKDADILSSSARTGFENRDLRSPYLVPPVVGAVQEVFQTYAIDPRGKKAVVIGAGFLVGAPVATWLRHQGADVVVVTLEAGDVQNELLHADIIVSGAGSPHLITPDMLKEGAILFDAGTSESGGVVVGDADPACAEKCSLFTPVPGGVGPLAVAKLFENACLLTERHSV